LTGTETVRNQTVAGALAVLITKMMSDAGYASYAPEASVIIAVCAMAVITTAGNLIRNVKENSNIGRWIG
jgi:hypothetical protein